MNLKKFFRTPKGLMILVLIGLTWAALFTVSAPLALPLVVVSAITAMAVDAPILRYREGEWVFPDGALLTGMFIGAILTPHEPRYVAAITSAAAIVSKYVFRAGRANVFNPAALALFLSYFVFHTGQSWWGALPEAPLAAIVLLLAAGSFITERVNKIPVVLAFLGAYFALFTIMAFAGDPHVVAAMYRAPDLHAALYFAFFMVTDPPTSPPKHRDQWIYGVIVAVIAFAIYESTRGVYFLLGGLLVANMWEAARRARARSARTVAATA